MIRYFLFLALLTVAGLAKGQLIASVLEEVQDCNVSSCDQLDVNTLKFALSNSSVLTATDSILTSLESEHGRFFTKAYVVYHRDGFHFDEFAYVILDVSGVKSLYGLSSDAATYQMEINQVEDVELISEALKRLIAVDDGFIRSSASLFIEKQRGESYKITLNQNPHPYTVDIMHLLFRTVVIPQR